LLSTFEQMTQTFLNIRINCPFVKRKIFAGLKMLQGKKCCLAEFFKAAVLTGKNCCKAKNAAKQKCCKAKIVTLQQ